MKIYKRRVIPAIEPGYLRDLVPDMALQHAESFEDVINDFDNYIMPGIAHWIHPQFHAYFPTGNAFPNILADMISDAIGAVGFSWAACPAMTKLEIMMLHWLGRMIGLPDAFYHSPKMEKGSASDCNFISLLAARFQVLKELRQHFPLVEEGLLLSKLVAYCSKEAHSSVEKACMIGMVKLKTFNRGAALKKLPLKIAMLLLYAKIGPICQKNDLWLHVDGAYGGNAMICPEFRPLMEGIEYAMSFNTNPNKFMLINFDCSTLWVKDRYKLMQALTVDPLYLRHNWTEKAIDYRHWGIPLSRRFRSLKLCDSFISLSLKQCRLAKLFENFIRTDNIFEIVGDVILGLVYFRMIVSEEMNQALLSKLNSSGRIHMVSASLNGHFVIRFCVSAEHTTHW
ncbi:Aromatic-L-amino-acid decarboxylase [Dirofilaria immitis]|nr:Aromatic-L-amino-acid decarboxylase [Dirofilaria immitis]